MSGGALRGVSLSLASPVWLADRHPERRAFLIPASEARAGVVAYGGAGICGLASEVTVRLSRFTFAGAGLKLSTGCCRYVSSLG